MSEARGGRPTARRVLRRYVPLAAVVAVQLLLAAFVPSTPPIGREGLGATAPLLGDAATPGSSAISDTHTSVAAGGEEHASSPPTTSGDGSPVPVPAGTAPAATPVAATPAAGSTAHCVGGRQFDPAIDFYAPPCQPRFTGPNPGSTARGVTDDEILLVDYYFDPGPAISAFLEAQQIAASADEQARFDEAAEAFINRHFELYGRRVRIELWKSQCGSPPAETCLRADAAQLVADKKPFAVVNNALLPMSFFYDELSQRRTVNVGGWHYRDAFSAARRPYHWAPNISGTVMARTFAEWYCGQLHGRPVQYAGQPRPPDKSFNGRPRVLGVLGFNDPETKAVVTKELEPALAACGARVAHSFFVEPNLATAGQQNRSAIAAFRSDPETTTLLCICGPAVAQGYQQMSENNYYPEHLMAGASMMDLDSVAQLFSSPLGCATGSNCQAENLFGLAQFGPQEPRFRGVGSRIWRASGNTGDPPYERVDVDWTFWRLLASLIQAAGPDLTPEAMARAAPNVPGLGGAGTGMPLRQFTADSHSAIRDMRVVYWSTTKRSPYNGATGTWVQVGDRFGLGAGPSGPLLLPPKPR